MNKIRKEKEKNEYTIGKGILYIGGKLVEGVVYIGGKIVHKAGEGRQIYECY